MSWFVSPLLSGIMSGILFFLVRAFILRKVTFLLTTSRESFSLVQTPWYSFRCECYVSMWLWKAKKFFVLYLLYVVAFCERSKFLIPQRAFRKEKLGGSMGCQETGETGSQK